MLYDMFICHASEDKENFVRPLAEALRRENVEVWYDEFTLKWGESIRRSIDKRLKQSRFGIVILSKSFFAKQWPQYELDGLAEREMNGKDKVVLPIWHGVTHDDVMQYSLSLAGRRAISSIDGMSVVVDAVLDIVHPQQSPLIIARDMLIDYGITPPVVTDQYWLEVTEASNRLPGFGGSIPAEASWDRWSFPLPPKGDEADEWGEKLAWTAMQMNWVQTADETPISPLSKPTQVLDFIATHPGLSETCFMYPGLLAEYAPQLTIRSMGGPFESIFEDHYQQSLEESIASRSASPGFGTALTTDGDSPLCDETWALRHPTFGNYKATHVAASYFEAEMFGPRVSPYYGIDHAMWLLSRVSTWLPQNTREYLLQGMKDWISWQWGHLASGGDRGGDWPSNGALYDEIYNCLEKRRQFKWTKRAEDDARNRIMRCIKVLALPDSFDDLFNLFVANEFPQHSLQAERNLRRRRLTNRQTTATRNAH
jgi:hypothetical protein